MACTVFTIANQKGAQARPPPPVFPAYNTPTAVFQSDDRDGDGPTNADEIAIVTQPTNPDPLSLAEFPLAAVYAGRGVPASQPQNGTSED
jgi:hypothetical protein